MPCFSRRHSRTRAPACPANSSQSSSRRTSDVATPDAGQQAVRRLPFHTNRDLRSKSFLLQRVQPALSGLMDGSLSTLAPIFAVAIATHRPLTAFYTGLATALGAGVSMAFSEGLSDTGDLTGR